MQIYNIETNAQEKELTVHGSNDFPCAFYDERFSEFLSGEVPWHWHEELEIVLVVYGQVRLECIGKSEVITQGDLVLINSGVLHKLSNDSHEDSRILNVVFNPRILGGEHFSLIYKKYVYPITHNAELSYYKFTDNVDWHKRVISAIMQGFNAWQNQVGYELTMTLSLMQFWQLLCENDRDLLSTKNVSSKTEKRILSALRYIHDQFPNEILVSDISRSVNISDSECYRLFKNALGCTPNHYLLSYRLRFAATRLIETSIPITDVAQQSGFNCPAYFAKKFRGLYKQTPKQYRNEYSNKNEKCPFPFS